MGHAKVLSKLDNAYQIKELTDKIITEGLSVRALEDITGENTEYERRNKVHKKEKTENPYKYIEEDLNRLLEIMHLDN